MRLENAQRLFLHGGYGTGKLGNLKFDDFFEAGKTGNLISFGNCPPNRRR